MVTHTGRYPASLVFREPGLSSNELAEISPLNPSATTYTNSLHLQCNGESVPRRQVLN
jgi:hypothetical protein